MLASVATVAPKVLGVLAFIDIMLFLTGSKLITGWILDKLGW